MRVQYFEWDETFLAALPGHSGVMRLFNYLLVQQGGDVEAVLDILRELQARGMLGPDADIDAFERSLEEQSVVVDVNGRLELTARGERGLRQDALDHIFGSLRSRGEGDHPVAREGGGREPLSECRPWEFGDELENIDFRRSIANAM